MAAEIAALIVTPAEAQQQLQRALQEQAAQSDGRLAAEADARKHLASAAAARGATVARRGVGVDRGRRRVLGGERRGPRRAEQAAVLGRGELRPQEELRHLRRFTAPGCA